MKILKKYDRRWLYGYSFETYLFGLVLSTKTIISKEVPVEIKYKIDENTDILCPLTIGSKAKYHSIRWKLLVSDYTMLEIDSDFWKNPI